MITLQLVDPRFYHLDTALCVLDEHNVAYLPEAFSPGSQAVLRQLFPDAVHRHRRPTPRCSASTRSATAGTSCCPRRPPAWPPRCASAATSPIGVDLSELRKAGGGPKCCTLEVRG